MFKNWCISLRVLWYPTPTKQVSSYPWGFTRPSKKGKYQKQTTSLVPWGTPSQDFRPVWRLGSRTSTFSPCPNIARDCWHRIGPRAIKSTYNCPYKQNTNDPLDVCAKAVNHQRQHFRGGPFTDVLQHIHRRWSQGYTKSLSQCPPTPGSRKHVQWNAILLPLLLYVRFCLQAAALEVRAPVDLFD